MKKVLVTGAVRIYWLSFNRISFNKGMEVVGIDGRIEERRKAEYEMKEMSFLRNSNYKLINQ